MTGSAKSTPNSSAFKLRDGKLLISTEAPGGIYNSSQLKKIAAICESEGAIIKATEDQRIALFVSEERAANVEKELKLIGLGIRHYQNGLHQPVSCVGELCPDHLQDALGSAMDISMQLESIKLENSSLKIGINGCAKCCVPCHTLDISVVGDMNGYKLSLGGKSSLIPEMATFLAEGIPAVEISRKIRDVILLYQKNVQGEQSLQEVIERIGMAPFINLLKPYSQDAAGGDDSLGSESLTETTKGDASNDLGNLDLGDELTEETFAEEIMEAPADEMLEVHAEKAPAEDIVLEDLSSDVMIDDLEPEIVGDLDISAADGSGGQGEKRDDLQAEVPIHEANELEELAFDEIGSEANPVVENLEEIALVEEEKFEEVADLNAEASIQEDLLENEIEMSITEQEKIPELKDDMENDRLEMLEITADQGADLDSEVESLEIDSGTSNASEDDLAPLDMSEEILEPEAEHVMESLDEPMSEAKLHEVAALDLGSDGPSDSHEDNVVSLNPEKEKTSNVSSASSNKAWTFSGFRMDQGNVVLTFSSGAQMTVQSADMQMGEVSEMDMSGVKLKLQKTSEGLKVTVNRVEILVPKKAA